VFLSVGTGRSGSGGGDVLDVEGDRGQDAVGGAVAVAPVYAAARRKRQAVGSVFLRTVAATFRPSAANLSTRSLPKLLEVPVVTMVRGTLASYAEVTSWDTLRSPSPRPNPQKLLVPARDLLVVARGLAAAGYR
jgi:hypothetical protein